MSNTTASDPDADKLAMSCFDLLLIELVPLASRLVADLQAREAALVAQHQPHSHTSTSSSATTTATLSPTATRKMTLPDRTSTTPSQPDSTTASSSAAITSTATAETMTATVGGGAASDTPSDSDATRAQIHHRLDALGYRVGQGLVERFASTLPARPNTPLDKIKFVCKDLWTVVFRKQIDNLKTNHRGTFVLTDGRFMPLARVSADRGRGARAFEEALGKAQSLLVFPAGVLRGALQGLGMDVTVMAETGDLKSAVFQIRTVGSKP